MTGSRERELAAFDHRVHLSDGYISYEDEIVQERELQVAGLRASHLVVAKDMATHALHVFNLDISDATVSSWQERLLKRQF